MASSVAKVPYSLLLVGKTGTGKSSTGNSILGRNVFKALKSMSSVTKQIEIQLGIANGQYLRVADSPGLMDTDLDDDASFNQAAKSIEDIILQNPDGYHAILIVVNLNRFTSEEVEVVDQLKHIFGPDFIKKHGILIVTHADNYDPEENGNKSIEQWISQQKGDFEALKTECCNRVVPFSNKKSTDEATKEIQLKRLLKHVEGINIAHGRYNDGCFEKARKAREECLLKLKEPAIMEKVKNDCQFIRLEIEKSDAIAEKEQAKQHLENVKSNISNLMTELKKEIKEGKVLDNANENYQTQLSIVEVKLQKLHLSIVYEEKMQIELKKCKEEINASHNKELKELQDKLQEMDNQLKLKITALDQIEKRQKSEYQETWATKVLPVMQIISGITDLVRSGFKMYRDYKIGRTTDKTYQLTTDIKEITDGSTKTMTRTQKAEFVPHRH